jgi:hypothetical protein
MSVSEYTLLPDVPRPLRRYEVTVTIQRPDANEALPPPGGQVAAELAAAVIAAEGLLTAWTSTHSVVSMVVELPSTADALAAGVAVARLLQGGDGIASVKAEPVAPGLRLPLPDDAERPVHPCTRLRRSR